MLFSKSLPMQSVRQWSQRRCATSAVSRRRKPPTPPTVRPGEEDPLLADIARDLNPVEAVRLVQWYPGHIAKAEKSLREQLSAVDIILEVRDGRIPRSTHHPQVKDWIGSRPSLLLLNRKDMVGAGDRNAWSDYFSQQGQRPIWTNGNDGEGVAAVIKLAKRVGETLNEKRSARGLRPRAVRAVVIGFPNVGKSALINRLLGRRVAASAPRPGVTRTLSWARIGGELDLLDAPGIIPAALRDQVAAARLAMCNDIGEAAYVTSLVAAAFIDTVLALPCAPQFKKKLEARYKIQMGNETAEEYVNSVGDRWFNGEPERAGQRILKDYQNLALGRFCLELPPSIKKE